MTEVRCTVSDCHYWEEGNRCAAELIWVTLDRFAGADDVEVGSFENVRTVAQSSSSTCCHTYRPRSEEG